MNPSVVIRVGGVCKQLTEFVGGLETAALSSGLWHQQVGAINKGSGVTWRSRTQEQMDKNMAEDIHVEGDFLR